MMLRRGAPANKACAQSPEGHRFAVTLRVSRALTIIATRLGLWHHQRRARGSRTCSTLAPEEGRHAEGEREERRGSRGPSGDRM